MAATNYTIIRKNKENEKIVTSELKYKWTYKQALALAMESTKEMEKLICVIETNKILIKNDKEKEADKIAESSAMTPKKYREHLKEELAGEADHWGNCPSVPVWCGTFVIVKALERAYKRGYSAGRRASQQGHEARRATQRKSK